MDVVLSRRAWLCSRCIWYMLLFLVRTFSKHDKREGVGDGGREKERERERGREWGEREILKSADTHV